MKSVIIPRDSSEFYKKKSLHKPPPQSMPLLNCWSYEVWEATRTVTISIVALFFIFFRVFNNKKFPTQTIPAIAAPL